MLCSRCDLLCQHKFQRSTVEGYVKIKRFEYDLWDSGSAFLGDDVFRNHFYYWCDFM